MAQEKKTNKNMNVEEKTFKFSWAQIFSNANGKTSATALVGFISAMICLILFCVLVVFYFFNITEASTVMAIIDKTITYFSISAGLLGVRSISSTLANGDRIKIGNSDKDKDEEQPHQHYQPYQPTHHYGPSYGSSSSQEVTEESVDEGTNDATTGLSEDDMLIPDEE